MHKHNLTLTARLFSFTAAGAVMLAVFDTVVLLPETLPDVKVARAMETQFRAAATNTLVAAAATASASR